MSPSTFVKWFFAWLAAFEIDFQNQVDPWCRHKPKIIAGDGMHIGVGVKNLNLEKSVQKVYDKDTTRKNYQRHYDISSPTKTIEKSSQLSHQEISAQTQAT